MGKGKELKRGERKLKPCNKRKGNQKVETVKTNGFKRVSVVKALDLGFMVELNL